MRYPIVIHQEGNSAYGVTVPDIPGCFAAGDTFDEAMTNAREAIYAHLELLTEGNEDIPAPSPIEQHRKNPDLAGGDWAYVEVDVNDLLGPAERVNVTIPRRTLQKIDAIADRWHMNRSSLLTRGALDLIATAHEGGRYVAYVVKSKRSPIAMKKGAAKPEKKPALTRVSSGAEKKRTGQRKAN